MSVLFILLDILIITQVNKDDYTGSSLIQNQTNAIAKLQESLYGLGDDVLIVKLILCGVFFLEFYSITQPFAGNMHF